MFFYNDSAYDNDNPAINAADDAAVATDKQALGELGHATFVNYSSYDKGINGVMIDIDNVPGTPTLADFVFRAGDSGDPFSWSLAPAPTGFFMRNDQGAGGADRIEFTWDASSAVKNQWLQVTVLPTSNTGLYQQDTFYFGSAIGETGNSTTKALVNLADYGGVFGHFSGFSSVGVDNPYDINRDGGVNLADSGLVLANQSGFSPLILISTPINPAGHLQSEVFSGHEVRLTWQDQSGVEAGYQVGYATYPDKTFTVLQTLGANRTGTLITGLQPRTGYWFRVTAIAPAAAEASSLQPAETNASAPQSRAPTLLLMTPADSGDGPTTYEIGLPDFNPAKGEASYSASGSLALNDDQPAIDDHTVLVQAYSEEAAIEKAFQGTITITNGDNQTHDYQFSDGPFDYGTVDALYARHNTADAPFDRPGGLSSDDYAIVLEDSYQWTDIDKDYDDFYWAPTTKDVKVDLKLSDPAYPSNQVTSDAPKTLFVEVNSSDQATLAITETLTPSSIDGSHLLWSIVREDSSTPVATGDFSSGDQQTATLSITPTAARFTANVGFDFNQNGTLDQSEFIQSLDAGLVKITQATIQDTNNPYGVVTAHAGQDNDALWLEGWHPGGPAISIQTDINLPEAAQQVIVHLDNSGGSDQQMTLQVAQSSFAMSGYFSQMTIGFDRNNDGVLDGIGPSLAQSDNVTPNQVIPPRYFSINIGAFLGSVEAAAHIRSYDLGWYALYEENVGVPYHLSGALLNKYFSDNDVQQAVTTFGNQFDSYSDQIAAQLSPSNTQANIDYSPSKIGVDLTDTIFSFGNGELNLHATGTITATKFDANGHVTEYKVDAQLHYYTRDKFKDPYGLGIETGTPFDLDADKTVTVNATRTLP